MPYQKMLIDINSRPIKISLQNRKQGNDMFTKGQMVQGYILDNEGNEVLVTGYFEFRTNDPEEYIQDIVIREADTGQLVYIDEQYMVRPN